MGESKFQLADELVGSFRRVVEAEMPSRVYLFPSTDRGGRRSRSGEDGDWASHPVALIALDGPVVLNVERREPVQLRVGDVLLLRARDFMEVVKGGQGSLLGVETLGSQPCRFFLADASHPAGTRRDIELFCSQFADKLSDCWRACHEAHGLMESTFLQAVESGSPADPALRNAMRLTLAECCRALETFRESVSQPVGKSNVERLAAAEEFISCNIGRDVRKPELAEHVGVSVSQLTLAFREIGRLAVRDRIRFRRVESARNLLEDTDLSVAEVAEKVGMNYRHFIRAFRQNSLLTPLRYRKFARRASKSAAVWDEILHTENFDLVGPLPSLNGDGSGNSGEVKSGAISVLMSNATGHPVKISRLAAGGSFVDLGMLYAQKRLSFFDMPGSFWKLEWRDRPGSEQYFRSGDTNSHFVFHERAGSA